MIDDMAPAALIFFPVTAFQTDAAGDLTAFLVWHGYKTAYHSDRTSAVIVRSYIAGGQRLCERVFFAEFGVADGKARRFLPVKVKTKNRLLAAWIAVLDKIIDTSRAQVFKKDPFFVGVPVEDPVPVGVSACFVDASLIVRPAVCLGDRERFGICHGFVNIHIGISCLFVFEVIIKNRGIISMDDIMIFWKKERNG